MPISTRINDWVEDRRRTWGKALGEFLLGVVSNGITKFSEGLEPGVKSMAQKSLDSLQANPAVPAELKNQLAHAQAAGNILETLYIEGILILQAIPVLLAGSQPLANELRYSQERKKFTARLDPDMVLTAWRRDPAAAAAFFGDLADQGWSNERIEILQSLTQIIPGVQDLVRMSVREAFSPEIAEKFGQYQDPPTAVYPWAEKIGLSKEWVDRYWAAHWDLPSAGEGFELLHRGIITEPDLKLLLRARDIMPYWRDKLIQASWNIPTRVDVRRFWDMRTIDEARLRKIYTGLGYHGQDLEDYVLWTKIFVDFPDLLARYKNGWLTLDQVRSELVAMGMKPERAATLIEEKIKKAAPERVAAEKSLTKTEIYKGVKQEKITWEQGVELLIDLGYDNDEANYLLAINIAVATGSPENYAEFKDLTQKYRKATGLEGKPMNENIRAAAQAVILLTSERDTLQRSIDQEKRSLIPEDILPAAATARLTQLQASLRKAEAALNAAKTDYSRLVAELKHTA